MQPQEQHHSIDMFMAKELNQLSFDERNNINEEIHGVYTRYNVRETPEQIARSLEELEFEIVHNVPMFRKAAYQRSLVLQQQQQQQHYLPSDNQNQYNHNTCSKNTRNGPAGGMYYTNDPSFRVVFLRTALWDAHRAALRFVSFLDLVFELWGDIALTTKIWTTQACFDASELRAFRSGNMQVLPGRDRAGRRIMGNFADNSSAGLTVLNRVSRDSPERNGAESNRIDLNRV